MAAFTHLNPDGGRFTDSTYNAFYGGLTIDTAIAETKYHREEFLAATEEGRPIDIDMGAAPSFVFASSIYRIAHRPALLGSFATIQGYASAWLKRAPRYEDGEFRRYLRHYHRAMLTRGRKRATRLLDREAQTTWTKRKSTNAHA